MTQPSNDGFFTPVIRANLGRARTSEANFAFLKPRRLPRELSHRPIRETGAIRAVANPATRVSEAPHVTSKKAPRRYLRSNRRFDLFCQLMNF